MGRDLYDDITERFNYYNTGEEGMHWNDKSDLRNFMEFQDFQDLVGDLKTSQEGSTLHSAQQYRTKDLLVDFGDTWDYVHGDYNQDIIGYKFRMGEVMLDLPSEAADAIDPKPAVDGQPAVDAVPAQKVKHGLLTIRGEKYTVDRVEYNKLVADETTSDEPPLSQDDEGNYLLWGRPVHSNVVANDIGWIEEGLLSEYVEPVQVSEAEASAAGDHDLLDLNGPLAVKWMEDNPDGTAKELVDYLNHMALPDHTGHNHDRR